MRLTHLLHAVSVLGVVAIVGTVTGTTTASWTDTATLDAGTLRSGFLSLAATPTDTTLTVEPNKSVSTTITLHRDGAGENLRAVTSLTAVASEGLPVAVRTKQAGDCPQGNANGQFTTWEDAPIELAGDSADVTSSLTVCVRLTLPKGHDDAAVPVDLTFTNQQVRDGQPIGWTARATSRIVVQVPAANGNGLAASSQAATPAEPADTPEQEPASPAPSADTPTVKQRADPPPAKSTTEAPGETPATTPAEQPAHSTVAPAPSAPSTPSSNDEPLSTEETQTP